MRSERGQSERGQVRFLLFDKAASILRTRRARFFSCATLDFVRKNAELADEAFILGQVRLLGAARTFI